MPVKVLVIEDDDCLRDNAVELLKAEGYEAYSAIDGEKGLMIAKEILPDLVLCDINMPLMNGYEVYKALQENSETADIPFVFTTAKVQAQDIRFGMHLGVDDYITKPYSFDDLLKTIQIRLKKSERRKWLSDQVEKKLMNNPLFGVFVISENKLTYANDKMFEIIGCNKSTDVDSFNFYKHIHPEDLPKLVDLYKKCLQENKNSADIKFRIVKQNNDIVNVSAFISGLKKAGKINIIGYVNRPPVMNDDQAINKLKHAFLSLIGQSINDPIKSLKSPIDILKNNIENKELHEIINLIDNSIDKLENFAEKIIEITNIKSGNYNINITDNNLLAACEIVLIKLNAQIQQKNITIDIKVKENLFVKGEANLIVKCIENIIENAIKYSHMDGKIILNAFQYNNIISLQIQDFGKGINTDFLVRFNTNPDFDSTLGIGLMHTKMLMNAMHGYVEIIKDHNSGTTVVLNFK